MSFKKQEHDRALFFLVFSLPLLAVLAAIVGLVITGHVGAQEPTPVPGVVSYFRPWPDEVQEFHCIRSSPDGLTGPPICRQMVGWEWSEFSAAGISKDLSEVIHDEPSLLDANKDGRINVSDMLIFVRWVNEAIYAGVQP